MCRIENDVGSCKQADPCSVRSHLHRFGSCILHNDLQGFGLPVPSYVGEEGLWRRPRLENLAFCTNLPISAKDAQDNVLVTSQFLESSEGRVAQCLEVEWRFLAFAVRLDGLSWEMCSTARWIDSTWWYQQRILQRMKQTIVAQCYCIAYQFLFCRRRGSA